MNINELIALGNNVAALSEIAGVINTNEEITISVKGGNNEPKSIVLAGQAREKILNLVSAELQSVMKVYTDINLKLTQHNTNVDEVVRMYADNTKNREYGSQMLASANSILNSIDNLMNTITTELNHDYSGSVAQPVTEDPHIEIPDESSSDEETTQPEEADASIIE